MRRLFARFDWRRGISAEIAFWDGWFARKGGRWADDYRWRLDPESLIQPTVADLIDAPAGAVVKILDVGAGPLTILGKRLPGRTVELTAVDALADRYNAILDKYGVKPPVRTVPCRSEDLSARYPHNSFDLVHARNSLDHGYDPVEAVRQMIMVLKPGCRAVLIHKCREGESEGYFGLHQWDFFVRDGRFHVADQWTETDISRLFAKEAHIECEVDDRNFVIARFRKL